MIKAHSDTEDSFGGNSSDEDKSPSKSQTKKKRKLRYNHWFFYPPDNIVEPKISPVKRKPYIPPITPTK